MYNKLLLVLKELLADFKCRIGKHHVSKDWAFEEMAAIFAGGVCPRCGKLKQGKFLGNVWTGSEKLPGGGEMLTGFDVSFAASQGYKIQGSLARLEFEWEEKHKKQKPE